MNIYKYRRECVKGVKNILLITLEILQTLEANIRNFQLKNRMGLAVSVSVADMLTHYSIIV